MCAQPFAPAATMLQPSLLASTQYMACMCVCLCVFVCVYVCVCLCACVYVCVFVYFCACGHMFAMCACSRGRGVTACVFIQSKCTFDGKIKGAEFTQNRERDQMEAAASLSPQGV
jgi:hypothetical protein